MSIPEILFKILQEKSAALKHGAPPAYVHGLEAAMAIIRIAAREESK